MAQLYRYGTTNPVYFKLTLNGAAVAGITFDAADVIYSKDGAAGTNIGSECSETTFGRGWYKWQPSSVTQTQCKVGIINVKDNVGSIFDENGIMIITGGNSSAQYNGT